MQRISDVMFLLLLILTASCQVPATVDLPDEEPKLVLNIISQDSVKWRAILTQSKGVLEWPSFQPIPDATIMLFENGQPLEQLQFIDNTGYGHYEALVSTPLPGKTYHLEAVAPSLPAISAEYTHPEVVSVEDLKLELLGTPSSTNKQRMKFLVTFTDPPSANYYSVAIRQKSEDSEFPSLGKDLTLFYSNPAYEENKRVFTYAIALTDDFFQGTQVTLEFEANLDHSVGEGPDFLNFFTVKVQNMSEGMYNYLKTVYIQQLTQGEPFAQPVIVTNNIENGFGVFGGFTETEKTAEFRKP